MLCRASLNKCQSALRSGLKHRYWKPGFSGAVPRMFPPSYSQHILLRQPSSREEPESIGVFVLSLELIVYPKKHQFTSTY